ncbi:MAG: DUF4129 domain-containing protein [Thermoanaerobaculia bacterium]
MRLRPSALIVLWLLPAAMPTAAQQPSPLPAEEIRRRAREVLDHPSYQTELPGREALAGSGREGSSGSDRRPPRGGGSRAPLRDGDSRARADVPELRPPALANGVLMWIVVAIAVAFAVVWLIQEASRSRLRTAAAALPADFPSAAAEAAAVLPEVDEIEVLARRGAYGEAVHLLLQRAIAALDRRQRLAPALTSREVLRTAALVPAARDAFRELVAAAERFWFGGVALCPDDYERCAAAYRAVLDATAESATAESAG